jgi:lysophospholipase L1-like esterase
MIKINRLRRAFVNLLILLCACVVMLLFLELVARIILPPPKFDPALALYPFTRINKHNEIVGVSEKALYTTNRWGLRGDEPPADWDNSFTIIAIGGSTTLCTSLDDANTWPAQLQAQLRQKGEKAWVGNAGIDGHTSRGHVIMMSEVVKPLHPKAVIVLAGVNDLGISLSVDNSMWWDEVFNQRRNILSRSQLYQIIMLLKARLIDKVPEMSEVHGEDFADKPIVQSELTPLPDDLTKALPTLPQYKQNLEQMIDIAQAENIKILFMTQPLLYDDTQYWQGVDGRPWWVTRPAIPNLSAASTWKMMKLFNEEMLKVCQERNVPCYDLASQIPHDRKYFYDIAHFTDAGAALVAQNAAQAVATAWLVKK